MTNFSLIFFAIAVTCANSDTDSVANVFRSIQAHWSLGCLPAGSGINQNFIPALLKADFAACEMVADSFHDPVFGPSTSEDASADAPADAIGIIFFSSTHSYQPPVPAVRWVAPRAGDVQIWFQFSACPEGTEDEVNVQLFLLSLPSTMLWNGDIMVLGPNDTLPSNNSRLIDGMYSFVSCALKSAGPSVPLSISVSSGQELRFVALTRYVTDNIEPYQYGIWFTAVISYKPGMQFVFHSA